MTLCENCILYGLCRGRCGDTDPNFYAEEEENERYEFKQKAEDDYQADKR